MRTNYLKMILVSKTANELFCKETKFDELRNQWSQCINDVHSWTHSDFHGTWYREDQTVISACRGTQILYFCNFIQPNISNIYFFGRAWDICVKIRPTGWMQLSALKYHNMFITPKQFLSVPNCVADVNNNTLDSFDYPWTKLSNNDWVLSDYCWE